jgi:hypothetical protein
MNVTFACPICDCPGRAPVPGPTDWVCPACDHRLRLDARTAGAALSACAVCGNPELFRKKDFPHWLGMTILVVACLASVVTYGWYHKWLTWAILIGSALVDGILYLCVGDVLVCYRCDAHYRGCPACKAHPPFELSTGERYRQERIRRTQLQAGKKSGDSVR